ncbi:MAG: hypothetical protein E7638_04240, partial [Ruminococcaceae bacterium]|nr:hypothetical protein [Oscillospiraceae bacterium]
VFTYSFTPLMVREGTTFAMNNCVLEMDGWVQSLYSDSAWFYAPYCNKYTLVGTEAGGSGETQEPETNEPETNEPESNDPETNEPETNEPETNEPETNAPETNAPETNKPVRPEEPETNAPVVEGPDFDMQEWYGAVQYVHNQYYSVNAIAGEGGKAEASAFSAKYNSNVTVTITPDEGYEIKDVLVNNKSIGAVTEYKINRINKHYVVTAIFEKVGAVETEAPETEAPEAEVPATPFADVAADAWYAADVAFVYATGLMNGTSDTTFEPDADLTRAMIVTTLWRQEGEPTADAAAFSDVAEGEWYTAAVNWAAANGIVLGYEDGTFAPDKAITKEETIAIIARYAALKGIDTAEVSDAAEVTYSDWAAESVLWADKAGVLAIGAELSDLTAVANRAEIAAFLTRLSAVIAG